MKILLIDVNCNNGSSTGKIVYDLYRQINNSGNEAAICYGRGKNIVEKNIFKFGIDIETLVHALLTRITGFTGCFSPFSTYRLIRYIKKFKPDIVNVHELHAYFVNIKPLLLYLRKKNIKVVSTLHCEFMYTGKCGHSIECEKWKTECGDCPHVKEYPSSLFFDATRYMFNQKKKLLCNFETMRVITPSKWLAERSMQSFLKEYETEVIHNGIDTEIFCLCDSSNLKETHGINENTKVILAVAPGLMGENKGGKYILRLAERLKDKNIKFIMIGVDEPDSVEHSENTIVLGRIYDKSLLAQYYSMADFFVICSERENFPTTCLEAQCCGTPVCGFDVGGVKETFLPIEQNKSVEYGDIDRLAGCILENLENLPSKEELSRAAIEKFGKTAMFREYMRVFNELAKPKDK